MRTLLAITLLASVAAMADDYDRLADRYYAQRERAREQKLQQRREWNFQYLLQHFEYQTGRRINRKTIRFLEENHFHFKTYEGDVCDTRYSGGAIYLPSFWNGLKFPQAVNEKYSVNCFDSSSQNFHQLITIPVNER